MLFPMMSLKIFCVPQLQTYLESSKNRKTIRWTVLRVILLSDVAHLLNQKVNSKKLLFYITFLENHSQGYAIDFGVDLIHEKVTIRAQLFKNAESYYLTVCKCVNMHVKQL